jgi:hypothetical protein
VEHLEAFSARTAQREPADEFDEAEHRAIHEVFEQEDRDERAVADFERKVAEYHDDEALRRAAASVPPRLDRWLAHGMTRRPRAACARSSLVTGDSDGDGDGDDSQHATAASRPASERVFSCPDRHVDRDGSGRLRLLDRARLGGAS